MISVSSDKGMLYEWKYSQEKPYHLLKHIDHVNDLEYTYQYDDQGEISKVTCSDGTSYAMDQGVTEWGIKTVDENGKEKETYRISGDDYDDYVYTNGSVKATSNESEQHVYADGQKISTAKVLKETNQEKNT